MLFVPESVKVWVASILLASIVSAFEPVIMEISFAVAVVIFKLSPEALPSKSIPKPVILKAVVKPVITICDAVILVAFKVLLPPFVLIVRT